MATTWVALLRGINVGKAKRIAMADLRALLEALGYESPKTLANSGNVVFESGVSSATRLEKTLEAGAATALGLRTDFLLRSREEWHRLIDANRFAREAERNPGHLVLLFHKKAPTSAAVATLQGAIKGREVIRAEGRQLYVVYPDGIGTSTLTTAVIERTLGTRGTARNWNTVLKVLKAM